MFAARGLRGLAAAAGHEMQGTADAPQMVAAAHQGAVFVGGQEAVVVKTVQAGGFEMAIGDPGNALNIP
jgi:hypothetical protein